jgi:NAD(P)-dependent dehydrogenase (short-subunit alcohol dehydrogenase family)
LPDSGPANNGLGKETVLQLAKHDPAHIFLCARDPARGAAALADVRAQAPAAPLTLLQLDLASLASVAAAAESFNRQSDRLDLLINNAGIMAVPAGETEDGLELQLGVNHVGHALLTKLLLPTLLRTAEESDADVRVVTLSSNAHLRAPAPGFSPSDERAESSSPMGRYSRSKLANALFARELARRHPRIVAVSLHPGVIRTDLFTHALGGNAALGYLSYAFGWLVFSSVADGAKNTLWAATAPRDGIANGAYYTPVGRLGGGSEYARDDALAATLWDWTEGVLRKHGY